MQKSQTVSIVASRMDQHESFPAPNKIQKGLPQQKSIEVLKEENDNEWRRIETVHNNANLSDGDNETNLDQHALQIALEAEIELLANAPTPSVKDAILDGITMHKSLVSNELSSELVDLRRTEAFIDRQISNLKESINERSKFLNEQKIISQHFKDKRQDFQSTTYLGNSDGSENDLEKAKVDNEWLRDALRLFSDVISEYQENKAYEVAANKKPKSEFPYLDRASHLLEDEQFSETQSFFGPTDLKRKLHLINHNNNYHDDNGDKNDNDYNGRPIKCTFRELTHMLITRRINNPDDPFIALSPDVKDSHFVNLLVKSGVAERHSRDSTLLRLLDLTR